jgi:hypothetical protein
MGAARGRAWLELGAELGGGADGASGLERWGLVRSMVVVAAVAGWGLRLEKFDEIPRFSGVADVLLVSRNSIVRPIQLLLLEAHLFSLYPSVRPYFLSNQLEPKIVPILGFQFVVL